MEGSPIKSQASATAQFLGGTGFSWQQLPRLEGREDGSLLTRELHCYGLEKVKDFWDKDGKDPHFRVWKDKAWWQARSQGENLEDLYKYWRPARYL